MFFLKLLTSTSISNYSSNASWKFCDWNCFSNKHHVYQWSPHFIPFLYAWIDGIIWMMVETPSAPYRPCWCKKPFVHGVSPRSSRSFTASRLPPGKIHECRIGHGSIPNTIFWGDEHPFTSYFLMFTRGTRFWHTANWIYVGWWISL